MIKDNILYNESSKPNSREIEVLKNTFPQYFDKDGNFYWDRFKEILKNEEITLNKEGYELNFLGKSYARYLSSTRTETFIAPHTEHNEAEENKDSENLYIIGDNLDALKHLLGSYAGKIKCIYIDPPYNTGSDGFVYPDNFYFDAKKLSQMIGVEEEEAQRIINLKGKSSHSAWLTFMYPRLILARELLSDDGVIFISIDNNEQANLKLMCDEIFGEENNVGVVSNTNNPKGRSDDKFIATAHESLLVYARNISKLGWSGFEPTEKIIKRYNKTDDDGRLFREIDLRKTGENDLREDRPNLFYYFYYNEITGEFYPDTRNLELDDFIIIKPQREDGKDGNWRWEINTARERINEIIPKFMPTRKIWGVMQKDYLEERNLVKPTSSWTFKDINSERGTEDFVELGFDKRIFPKPKPLGLITRCTKLVGESNLDTKNIIILDFFSGSATTAHAVMNLNAEDGGNRKYIVVQLPELIKEDKPAYKEGYRTIDEIGRERIRRAANKIQEETGAKIDYGCKVYSLKSLGEEVLTNLDYFDDNPKLILDDMVGIFDTDKSKGKDAILSTYLALDGYGLSVNTQKYRLSNFEADKIDNSIYMIDGGLESDDVMELIKKIETLELDITRVVVYSPSLSFHVLHELKKNLSNLRNNKSVELIERY